MSWKRPESVPPTIWAEFEGKAVINGAKRKYWITDVTEGLYDSVIEHMTSGFLADEPLCRYSELAKEKESVEAIRGLYVELLRQNIALICFTKDEAGKDEIAAMNVTICATPDEETLNPVGQKWKIVYGIVNYVTKYNDFFKHYPYDKYMSAMGLFVLPKFRGEGIGLEMLKAREPICRAVGIPATCTVFTSIASQKLAQRAGFEEFTEISYDELSRINPEWSLPKIQEHTKSCKYMIKIFK